MAAVAGEVFAADACRNLLHLARELAGGGLDHGVLGVLVFIVTPYSSFSMKPT